MQVKEVRGWSNQIQVWGSSKSEGYSFCLPQPSFASWTHWESALEREDAPNQLERGDFENAHFWKVPPPACIIKLGFTFDFTTLPLKHVCHAFALSLHLFALYCSINVIHITHCPHALFAHLLGIHFLLLHFNCSINVIKHLIFSLLYLCTYLLKKIHATCNWHSP